MTSVHIGPKGACARRLTDGCRLKPLPLPSEASSCAACLSSLFRQSLHVRCWLREDWTRDHTCAAEAHIAHDVLMAPRLSSTSCLPSGTYSTEYRCRTVETKSAFWFRTLTKEANALWLSELAASKGTNEPPSFLQGRILIFASFHKNALSVHAAITFGSSASWRTLWGWEGFDGIPSQVSTTAKQTTAVKKTSASPKTLTKDEQWAQLLKKFRVADGDDWIQLPRFLPEVGEVAKRVKRFVQPAEESRKCWTRSDGGWPRHKTDWRHMCSGQKGGGNKGSGGPVHVRKAFLKHVFYSKHAI